jgi:predicted ester cyclase
MAHGRPPDVRPGGAAPGAPSPGGPVPGGPAPGGPPPAGPPPGAPGAPGAGDREGTIDLVKRFIDALNNRRWKEMQGMLADPHVDGTWFGRDPVKPQAVTRLVSMIKDTAPDWTESLDEILAVDPQTGWVVFLATGRGTFSQKIMGKEPAGRQIAVQQIQCVRIRDGKISEYRQHKHGMFENPFDEIITAPAYLQETRAEQGGTIQTREQIERRQRFLEAYAAGTISGTELAAGLQDTAGPSRCQAILRENFRRCTKPAQAGSIYCEVHSADVDPVHML